MKRIISLLLCVLMLVACFAGCGKPNNNSTVLSDGIVKTVEDFEKMKENTKRDFVISADIDFKGKEWKGFETFEGTLDGGIAQGFNYKISNIVIKASRRDQLVGFIKKLKGTVSNIDFENVTIELPKGFKGNAGVVAGEAHSDLVGINVTNVTIKAPKASGNIGTVVGFTEDLVSNSRVTGKMDLTLNGTSNVGAIAGICGDLENGDAETEIKTTLTDGKLNLGGLSGDASSLKSCVFDGSVNCKTEKGTSANVAGLTAVTEGNVVDCYSCATTFKTSGSKVKTDDYAVECEGMIDSCFKRDLSNLESKTMSKEEYNIRKKVVDYIDEFVSIRWSPSTDMYFIDDKKNGQTQYFSAGEWFFGAPFTYNGGSLERMKSLMDKNGVLSDEVGETGLEYKIGGTITQMYFWALQQLTNKVAFNTSTDIAKKVGNGMKLIDGLAGEIGQPTTEICALNGNEAILEAYARTKLGDIIVKEPGGHAYVITEAPHVVRNADGSINADKSYFIYDTQEAAVNTLQNKHSMCVYRNKQTFSNVFSYSYVPYTHEVFTSGEKKAEIEISAEIPDDAKLAEHDGWLVTSNYKIDSTYIVVEKDGKKVLNERFYPVHNKYSTSFNPGELFSYEQTRKLTEGEKYTMTIYVDKKDEKHKAATFDFIA